MAYVRYTVLETYTGILAYSDCKEREAKIISGEMLPKMSSEIFHSATTAYVNDYDYQLHYSKILNIVVCEH